MQNPPTLRVAIMLIFFMTLICVGYSQHHKGIKISTTPEGLSSYTFSTIETLSVEKASLLKTHFATKEGIKSCDFTEDNTQVIVLAKPDIPVRIIKDIVAANGYDINTHL